MNIALIIERIETWRGGAETSTMQFAEHLAELGCRVNILTTSYPPSTPALNIIPLHTTHRLRSMRTQQFARRAAAYVREHPFDVVHAITPCPAADVYQPRGGLVPEMLERNLAIRQSSLMRGFKRLGQSVNLKYRVQGALEHELLTRRPAPWVIAISEYVIRQLDAHYDFPPDRVRLIFNGVDPDISTPAERASHRAQIRRQFGLHDRDLMLLTVAHNFKLKGIAPMLKGLAIRVRQESADGEAGRTFAVIVGRDNPGPYVKLARALGVADRALFTGATPRVHAFFHAADVLVHDTYYDPCSRVVLEALSSGLPAITTRFNGAAERLTDGQEGYVIESPDDVEALADRIGRLSDPEHRHACARRAPRAVADATMQRHAERVFELYQDVVRTRQEAVR